MSYDTVDPLTAFLIPLRLKHRLPGRSQLETRKGCANVEQVKAGLRTWTYGGSNPPAQNRSGNSHGPTPKRSGKTLRPRRHCYITHYE